jgi:hypothetical protein
MVTAATPEPQPRCVNCGAQLVEKFCAGCGQRTPAPTDYSMRTLASAAIGHLTNWDGRLLSTVRKLFFRPGQLARDHFEGRRAQHLDPFRIFVLSNVLAWLIAPHSRMFGFSLKMGLKYSLFPSFWERALAVRAGLAHVTVEQFGQRIDAVSASENQVGVLCLVPLMACGIWLVMAGRRYRFVQHLIFTAQFYCIHLTCVLLYLGFLLTPFYKLLKPHALTAPIADSFRNLWVQHLTLAPVLAVYLYFALKRAYQLTPRQSLWRALILALWATTISRAFLDVVFTLVLIWA